MNAIHSTRHVPMLEVPALERDQIEPALDRAWLDAVAEYLDSAVIDGDPCTDFDCSRDYYQEAA